MKENNKKKGMGAVIALAVVIVAVLIVFTVAVVTAINENNAESKKESTTLYTLAGVTSPEVDKQDYLDWSEDQNQNDNTSEGNYNDGITNPGTNQPEKTDKPVVTDKPGMTEKPDRPGILEILGRPGGILGKPENTEEAGDVVTAPPTTKNPEKYDPIAEYEELTKNGDNVLSDHHNNKFIKLVAENFYVDKELLVAIYSVPDTGNNFVLEFSGKRDRDGNVIKSPDTLAKVYSIDKSQNISVATGKTKGNIGVSYAEGTLCFNMVKTIVMPQYPEYFTGVEK